MSSSASMLRSRSSSPRATARPAFAPVGKSTQLSGFMSPSPTVPASSRGVNGPAKGSMRKGPSGNPQAYNVWPKSMIWRGGPPTGSRSKSPPSPKVEFTANRMTEVPAATGRACRSALAATTGSFRFRSTLRTRVRVQGPTARR
jgi:hypothetical protein